MRLWGIHISLIPFPYSSIFLHISRERVNVRENVGIQECQLV